MIVEPSIHPCSHQSALVVLLFPFVARNNKTLLVLPFVLLFVVCACVMYSSVDLLLCICLCSISTGVVASVELELQSFMSAARHFVLVHVRGCSWTAGRRRSVLRCLVCYVDGMYGSGSWLRSSTAWCVRGSVSTTRGVSLFCLFLSEYYYTLRK